MRNIEDERGLKKSDLIPFTEEFDLQNQVKCIAQNYYQFNTEILMLQKIIS